MADAEQLYAAFRSVCPVDETGGLLPATLAEVKDGGRGWFAIANAVDEIARPALDVTAPYDVDLVEIPPRIAADGLPIQESEDERPTKIRIRAFTAADMCVREWGTERGAHAVFAKAVGVDLHTVEHRMAISDVQGGVALCNLAGGDDAAELCRQKYFAGGGEQAIDLDHETMTAAWSAVARALLVEIDGEIARVRCRTPGIGTLTIGPLRAVHLSTHTGTAVRETEMMGRLAAIAKASDRALGQMLALRPEDALAAWYAFDTLKKKAEARSNTAIAAKLSSLYTAGPKTTSST
jgi:hypothetical protein